MIGTKLISKNRRAYFDYEILDEFEAGIVLTGAEVKAVKNGQINLRDSFVRISQNTVILWNADISKYIYSSDPNYDPIRSRKLLLKKREIGSLISKSKASRLTIIPLKVYLKRGRVKILIGLAKGRRVHEKKARQKERDLDRELHREKRKYMLK
ncbi:SsrA-binding protein SmpB [Candidatus Dojkabacteria bacterium]|uniref:SsrA-binding protein n=1 Tax=Candidatus Dojkabacteria bacterium TaxID=2099670 RepID=A0A955HZH5_9BACT|nr:SsrA-binding protein SmpB [Candidatus Dojkabacteria bacterium]MCB9791053.1 SsrA-binding protein SmpB [Candidatus Nomurabacteria bacterium]